MTVSRQRVYQLKRVAEGVCSGCGKRPLASKLLCLECLEASRARRRVAKGCKPWRAGGRGRPPKGV